VELYIKEVVKLDGVPNNIMLDWDPRFTSRLWETFQESLGRRLRMTFAYHP